jgi:hypothetical protein
MVSGGGTWSGGGSMTGGGTTTLLAGSATTINIGVGVGADLARSLLNSGTAMWTGNHIDLENGTIVNSGTFLANANGGRMRNTGGVNLFTNSGTVLRTAGAFDTAFIAVPFNSSGTVSVSTGTLSLDGGGTGSATFTATAPGILRFGGGTYNLTSSAITTGSGTFMVSTATVNHSGSYSVDNTHLTSGGHLVFQPTGTGVLKTKTLTFAGATDSWSGRLDLTDDSMIIDYDGASPATNVMNQLHHSYNDGAWDRDGINSSSAAADSTKAIGYAESATLGLTTFAGQSVDSTSLLFKYTWFGDADLNGQVDVADLGNLASNWQTAAPWTGGDFDYSGFVDVADLGMLASNWQAGVGNPLGPTLADALASLGLPESAIPEPGSAVVAAACSLLLPCRRQKPIAG